MKELKGVKPGDFVIRDLTGGNSVIEEVQRVTKTMLITKSGRYNKETGKSIGSSIWHISYLRCAEQEEIDKILYGQKIKRIKNFIEYQIWDKVEDEKLIKIYNILMNKEESDNGKE